MDQEYFVRGQRKSLERIDDVVAIKIGLSESGAVESDFGPPASLDQRGLEEESLQAFRNAGWVFVEPPSGESPQLEAREEMEAVDAVGSLVKRENGRLGIVTKRLSVQLREELSEDEVKSILEETGLTLVNRLTFAPNLYEVNTTVHADALDASVALQDDSRFILVEP